MCVYIYIYIFFFFFGKIFEYIIGRRRHFFTLSLSQQSITYFWKIWAEAPLAVEVRAAHASFSGVNAWRNASSLPTLTQRKGRLISRRCTRFLGPATPLSSSWWFQPTGDLKPSQHFLTRPWLGFAIPSTDALVTSSPFNIRFSVTLYFKCFIYIHIYRCTYVYFWWLSIQRFR